MKRLPILKALLLVAYIAIPVWVDAADSSSDGTPRTFNWMAVAHPNGKHLYVRDYAGKSEISIFQIATGGELKLVGTSPFLPDVNLSTLVVDPLGEFLFGIGTGNKPVIYRIHPDGRLTSIQPGASTVSWEINSRSLIHPSGRFVYVFREPSNRISIIGLNREKGELTAARTFSLDCIGSTTMHPSGEFLVTASVIQDSDPVISVYRINHESGELLLQDLYRLGPTQDPAEPAGCDGALHISPLPPPVFDRTGQFIYFHVPHFGHSDGKLYLGEFRKSTGEVTFRDVQKFDRRVWPIVSDRQHNLLYLWTDEIARQFGENPRNAADIRYQIAVHEMGKRSHGTSFIKHFLQERRPLYFLELANQEPAYIEGQTGVPAIKKLFDSVEAAVRDDKIQFARLEGCQGEAACVISGRFSPGLRVTLLNLYGTAECYGRTGAATQIPNDAMGPIIATKVELQNCAKKSGYFLAVLKKQVRTFEMATIERIKDSSEEEKLERLLRPHNLQDSKRHEQDAQLHYDNEVTDIVDQRLTLYSYRASGVDARVVVYGSTSPYELNGPTVFVRDQKPIRVTHINYHGSVNAHHAMIGFVLNGEQYLLVSGAWCTGCGHRGIELHRLDTDKSFLVYANDDGST